jgi:SAM-dependent methyltransferase
MFTYWGADLSYCDHAYNSSRYNERAVEIPIVERFIEGRTGDGLEVGNVLAHYGSSGHRVVDLYELGAGVDNVDLFAISGAYDWVVSISTVEHVAHDTEPRHPGGAVGALPYLASLLRPGGAMIATVPMGHHPHLDRVLLAGSVGASRSCTLVRDGDGWTQTDALRWEPYGKSTLWAESVWVGEWHVPSR